MYTWHFLSLHHINTWIMFNLECFTVVIIVIITNLRLEYRQKSNQNRKPLMTFSNIKCSGTRFYLFILKVIVGMFYSWPFAFFKNLWINVNAWLQCIIFLKFTYVVLYPYVCNFVTEKSERSGLEKHGSMLHLQIIVKALTFNSHCRKDGWMIVVIPRL